MQQEGPLGRSAKNKLWVQEAEPASCHPPVYFLHSPQGKDRTTEAFSARASSLADKQDEQDIGDDVTAGQLVDPACLHLLLSPIL